MFIRILLMTLIFLGTLSQVQGQTEFSIESEKVKMNKVMSGLGIPWGMDFLSDDLLITTDKSGKLYLVDLKSKKKTLISGGPEVKVKGQGGLLDVKLAPNFKENKTIYFSYSKKLNQYTTTALAMGKLESASISDLKDIFVAKTDSNKGVHFGSRITFDEKHIYLSIGDRGYRDRAQMFDYHNGKIIRLNLDGSVPKDNPFVKRDKALPEIFSYGHRNPQGLFYDSRTQTLWSGEHGPKGGDEINKVEKGKNYGWPVITYGTEYWGPSIGDTHREGMEQPYYYFVPSIANCGLMVYSGKKFTSLKGHIFQGALKLMHLNMVFPGENNKLKEKRYAQDVGRVRSVNESPSGDIFLSTDSGELFRLTK